MWINEQNKKTFQSIILLNELINTDHKYQTSDSDNKLLEPLFTELMGKGYVAVQGQYFTPTQKGRDTFTTFMKRYGEFLRLYDIFSFVDLDKGEFAFAKYFDFDTDEQWDAYKNDPRFEDVRIAVAQFKKLDPAEIVFMAFINENRFDTTATGWQMDLVSDAIWDEVEHIINAAIKPEELGDDAMQDMITQGSQLMVELLKEEQTRNEQNNNNGQGEEEEVYETETASYYEPYYDPWYVSPIWLLPLFLW